MLREEVSKQVQARSAAEKALAEQPLLHLQAMRAMEHELRVRDANVRDLRSTADELLLQAQHQLVPHAGSLAKAPSAPAISRGCTPAE